MDGTLWHASITAPEWPDYNPAIGNILVMRDRLYVGVRKTGVLQMTTHRLADWLDRPGGPDPDHDGLYLRPFSDDELFEVWKRFERAVQHHDEGRDIKYWLYRYREHPEHRELLNDMMVALTGWKLDTIVTGVSEYGDVPEGFEEWQEATD